MLLASGAGYGAGGWPYTPAQCGIKRVRSFRQETCFSAMNGMVCSESEGAPILLIDSSFLG